METKLMELPVQEHVEGYPVELWQNKEGRLVVRVYSVDRYGVADVDLSDLILWLRDHQTIRVPKSVSKTEELILYGKMPWP